MTISDAYSVRSNDDSWMTLSVTTCSQASGRRGLETCLDALTHVGPYAAYALAAHMSESLEQASERVQSVNAAHNSKTPPLLIFHSCDASMLFLS
jgi:hypothetical protein